MIMLTIWKSARLVNRLYSRGYASSMQAWQAFEYGSPDVLRLSASLKIPAVRTPTDVLVEVHAASVNPLDVMMLKGYGVSVIQAMRSVLNCTLSPQEFPLILGRDFSGTVVNVGSFVKSVKPGDEVCGIVGPERQGSHANYVITPAYCVSQKPFTLSHVETASLPYVGLTAWSAICTFGQLSSSSTYGKRVLVFGGSGGVGAIAIQLLKAWGAEVTATCATDAVEMVQNLGADNIIDYQLQDLGMELKNLIKFDLVLDTIGEKDSRIGLEALKKWSNSKYVTIVSPLLQNADRHGLIPGTVKSLFQAAAETALSFKDGRSFRWAYVTPNTRALKAICEMADTKQIVPVVEKVFRFEEAVEAYRKLSDGHARGKTVIDLISIAEAVEAEPMSSNEQLVQQQ